ncbi:MAG: hypothetical protein JHC26_13080 [Thermofilum sp.]|jgi:hypothetical protein|uniref:hypothetical protein n=1 Tax=Thermofilum sp. TaxID=1961369 RepID=UPI00258CC45B|nr:hypothetical protein [Thermofilum sp.]MCI4410018.1 hypothetical protein [Thermofilum sp.]
MNTENTLKGFQRDSRSGAVLNRNIIAKEEYLAKKRQHQKIHQLESEVVSIKSTLSNIESLLQQLVSKS